MNLIRFIGNGEDEVNTKDLHLAGAITDHTLCGDTLDNDEGTIGHHEIIIGKKVTCPQCRSIIEHCRNVKI